MRLAIIPARGGSKRIPRKNIRPFFGRPMIAWSIDAARQSGCFDSILVSTDDREIADLALSAGCEVPFMRPAALSDDHAGTVAVIAHALKWALGEGLAVEHACCIYATAPFIQPADIRHGLDILTAQQCDYVFPVTDYAFPIQRAIRIDAGGRAEMFSPDDYATRSQDLEPAYHDAGQFYWGWREAWLAGRPIFSAASAPLVLPRYRVQDIDTPEDWDYAELIFKVLAEKQADSDKVKK